MPRRSKTRASNLHASATISPPPSQHDPHSENLLLLRRQWKWAAFSQFFFTFAQLFAMNDITISDIERDLIYETNTVLSRIMQRLLYTLSYDRKVSLDNWQSALRKQYNKRDPQANPIGQEPKEQTKDDDDESRMPVSEPLDPSLEELDGKQPSEKAISTPREISSSLDPGASDLPLTEDADLSRQSSVAQHRHCFEADQNKDQNTEQETSLDWFDLPMTTKLETMHTLAEWQFQNATRLRTIMKSDDEIASWRIEPIGYDSKRNAYWFIGGARLWIQRMPPKPAKSQSLKRKRTSNMQAREKAHPNSTPASTSKRRRLASVDVRPSSQKVLQNDIPTSSGRQSRAAKDQAKLKLDLQAKELAKINREAAVLNQIPKSSRPTPSRPESSRRLVGTRTSARLRGSQEDEWQPIPDDWLEGETNAKGGSAKSAFLKTGLESDQETISDLTELSEEPEEGSNSKLPLSKAVKAAKKGEDQSVASRTFEDEEVKQVQEVPENFVEWETLCVTLQEWEHIAEQFEKATHYAEKALYKTLLNDIVPNVTQELSEIERKRELEEALVHRKRSSRIALKESEREETRLAAKRKEEEEEKFSRARRMEARMQKEEADRIKRENAREKRRKEREAREESRKAPAVQERPVDKQGSPSNKKQRTLSVDNVHEEGVNGQKGSNSGSRTPAGDDWELSCEICHRHGVNLDDGTPMMSCGRCLKWQHILCHDRADQAAGRPRRNWDSVDFLCKNCRNTRQDHQNDRLFLPNPQLPVLNAPQMQAHRSYQPILIPAAERGPSAYAPAFREPAQQSYYVRPTNGHHHSGLNGQHTNSGQYPVAAPTNATRPTISFSHYQPAAHGFSGHKPYAEHQPYYGHPNQQYRPPMPQPYKPQTTIPAWNITTPAHAPGYSLSHNGSPVASSSTPFGNVQDDRQGLVPMNESSQALHRYPEQHYPSTQYPSPQYPSPQYPSPQYPSTQFKHHPTSYQPPLGR